MYSGQSACSTEYATAQECEDACISGGWDWCEWDPNPDATCNPDNTCPAPTQFFYCGGTGCCE